MEKEVKEGTQVITVDVYRTKDGLYLKDESCDQYKIEKKGQYKEIHGNKCYPIEEKDLDKINYNSKKKKLIIEPNIIRIFDLQLVMNFNVYQDINHDNILYIQDSLCSKYEITPIAKRIIKGCTYCQVEEKDIEKIEQLTKGDSVASKRKVTEISLDDQVKPAENLYTYYYDVDTQTMYVQRSIYELAKKNDIEIEGKPKILENKNCYSITEEQLKEIEEKTSYRGIERLLKPESQVISIPEPEKREAGTIIAYHDKREDKLYIPKEYAQNMQTEKKMILNKECYETTLNELENIMNKKIIVASVYPLVPKTMDIIICNNQGKQYIAKEVLDKLGFYIENPHKILVQKEIYQEITNNDIVIIKNKESKKLHLNIILKHITPSKKKG